MSTINYMSYAHLGFWSATRYGHRYTWRLAFGLMDLESPEQAHGEFEPWGWGRFIGQHG